MPTKFATYHCVICHKTERGPLGLLDAAWKSWRFWNPKTEHACPTCVRDRPAVVAALIAAAKSPEAKAAWISRRDAMRTLRARRTASEAGRAAR